MHAIMKTLFVTFQLVILAEKVPSLTKLFVKMCNLLN